MASWRERGFVPDSDDDEGEPLQQPSLRCTDTTIPQAPSDNDEVNVQPPGKDDHGLFDATPSVASPPSSGISLLSDSLDDFRKERAQAFARRGSSQWSSQTVEEISAPKVHAVSSGDRLGQLLSQGLETCREVLFEKNRSQSVGSDSPLSSPPASPLLSHSDQGQAQVRNLTDQLQQLGSPSRPTEKTVSPQPSQDESPASLGLREFARVRSFRPRNPLQVQPYTLEAAKYQLEWKRRGLRPVRDPVPHDGQQHGHVRPEEESQSAHSFASSQDESFRVLSPARRRHQSRDDEQSQSPIRGGRFPAAAEHLEQTKERASTVPNGTMLHRPALKVPTLRPPQGIPTEEANPYASRDDLERRRIDALFELPPSPPRSLSVSSGIESILGLNDMTVTPRLLPTPVLSSEQRRAKRNIVEVSSSSGEDDSDSGNGSFGERSVEAETHDLVHIRRRIRGVLPASWIRLDAQKQKPGEKRTSLSKSPEKPQTKGVARHIARPSSSSARQPVALDFSSDEEDETPALHTPRQGPERHMPLQSLIGQAEFASYSDDVMEEDYVDPMLPKLSRNKQHKARRKPRQQRLKESWASKEPRRRKGLSAADHTSDQHRRKSAPKKPKRMNVPIQLTVLDAPGLVRFDSGRRPQFLGVAARSKQQGRLRPQDPSRKFFKLANDEDTVEVNDELRSWRAGSSRFTDHNTETRNRGDRHEAPAQHDHVSYGIGHPGQPPSRPPPRDVTRTSALIQMLKDSTNTTLSRIKQPENDQTTVLDETISNDANIRSKKQPGFVSWSRNRGGRGKFWTQVLSRPLPLAVPRAPQSRSLLPLLNNASHRVNPTPETSPRHQVPKQPNMSHTLPSRPK
jgi:hypothetical protein